MCRFIKDCFFSKISENHLKKNTNKMYNCYNASNIYLKQKLTVIKFLRTSKVYKVSKIY